MLRNQDKCVLGNSSPFPECLKMFDSRPFIVSFSNYALGFSIRNLVLVKIFLILLLKYSSVIFNFKSLGPCFGT